MLKRNNAAMALECARLSRDLLGAKRNYGRVPRHASPRESGIRQDIRRNGPYTRADHREKVTGSQRTSKAGGPGVGGRGPENRAKKGAERIHDSICTDNRGERLPVVSGSAVIAKIILPWFGGSAAVWTVCMLFFQMALLLGYLYAHALVRYLKPRTQMLVHAALLLVSALALPIYPNTSWKPMGGKNHAADSGIAGGDGGLPYFLLSPPGTLLQAWYARRFQDPCRTGCTALECRLHVRAAQLPGAVRAVFTTPQQAWMWSAAYGVFVVLCGVTALRSGNAAAAEVVAEPEAVERPSARQYLMWLLLPAVASLLLLAITNHLSQTWRPFRSSGCCAEHLSAYVHPVL